MTRRILSCVSSSSTERDWTFEQALALGLFNAKACKATDLREDWWTIKDQGDSGACVGYATADGLLKWHFVKNKMLKKNQDLSPRFIWMANKETDELTTFPTTFIERAGTQTKLALKVAQKYGCVLDELLPMYGPLSDLNTATFYAIAARLRIKSYYNLGSNLNYWQKWIMNNGPIIVRVDVDRAWLNLGSVGELKRHTKLEGNAGHAVSIVGYTSKHFIIRNSWGTDWGDQGYAYVTKNYAQSAFSDAYGAIV